MARSGWRQLHGYYLTPESAKGALEREKRYQLQKDPQYRRKVRLRSKGAAGQRVNLSPGPGQPTRTHYGRYWWVEEQVD